MLMFMIMLMWDDVDIDDDIEMRWDDVVDDSDIEMRWCWWW